MPTVTGLCVACIAVFAGAGSASASTLTCPGGTDAGRAAWAKFITANRIYSDQAVHAQMLGREAADLAAQCDAAVIARREAVAAADLAVTSAAKALREAQRIKPGTARVQELDKRRKDLATARAHRDQARGVYSSTKQNCRRLGRVLRRLQNDAVRANTTAGVNLIKSRNTLVGLVQTAIQTEYLEVDRAILAAQAVDTLWDMQRLFDQLSEMAAAAAQQDSSYAKPLAAGRDRLADLQLEFAVQCDADTMEIMLERWEHAYAPGFEHSVISAGHDVTMRRLAREIPTQVAALRSGCPKDPECETAAAAATAVETSVDQHLAHPSDPTAATVRQAMQAVNDSLGRALFRSLRADERIDARLNEVFAIRQRLVDLAAWLVIADAADSAPEHEHVGAADFNATPVSGVLSIAVLDMRWADDWYLNPLHDTLLELALDAARRDISAMTAGAVSIEFQICSKEAPGAMPPDAALILATSAALCRDQIDFSNGRWVATLPGPRRANYTVRRSTVDESTVELKHISLSGDLRRTTRQLRHEIGHGLGLKHASSLDCNGDTIGTDCAEFADEYGNVFDTMGKNVGDYSGAEKSFNAWTLPVEAALHAGTQTFQVEALTSGARQDVSLSISLSPRRAGFVLPTLKTHPNGDPDREAIIDNPAAMIFVDYRIPLGLDEHLEKLTSTPTPWSPYYADVADGLLAVYLVSGSRRTFLLDCHPRSIAGKRDVKDALLAVGESCDLTRLGMRIIFDEVQNGRAVVRVTTVGDWDPPHVAVELQDPPDEARYVAERTCNEARSGQRLCGWSRTVAVTAEANDWMDDDPSWAHAAEDVEYFVVAQNDVVGYLTGQSLLREAVASVPPFAATLDISSLDDGFYWIYAYATDMLGNVGVSAPVSFEFVHPD